MQLPNSNDYIDREALVYCQRGVSVSYRRYVVHSLLVNHYFLDGLYSF